MRKLFALVVSAALLVFGCEKKPEIRYNPDRVENEKHKAPPPESAPQAGVDGLNHMKQIQQDEKKKQEEAEKVKDQIDN